MPAENWDSNRRVGKVKYIMALRLLSWDVLCSCKIFEEENMHVCIFVVYRVLVSFAISINTSL